MVVDPPIGRKAIEEQTPQILIESPLPGDTVSSPIRLRGTANVFEATVSIEVRDETGAVEPGVGNAVGRAAVENGVYQPARGAVVHAQRTGDRPLERDVEVGNFRDEAGLGG